MRPGGARSVAVESLLLKHQLLILNRSRERAPNLRVSDRLVAGLCALMIRPARLLRTAIVLKPSTLMGVHRASRMTALGTKRMVRMAKSGTLVSDQSRKSLEGRFPVISALCVPERAGRYRHFPRVSRPSGSAPGTPKTKWRWVQRPGLPSPHPNSLLTEKRSRNLAGLWGLRSALSMHKRLDS
jgi:hypothetical protein